MKVALYERQEHHGRPLWKIYHKWTLAFPKKLQGRVDQLFLEEQEEIKNLTAEVVKYPEQGAITVDSRSLGWLGDMAVKYLTSLLRRAQDRWLAEGNEPDDEIGECRPWAKVVDLNSVSPEPPFRPNEGNQIFAALQMGYGRVIQKEDL